MSPGPLVSTEWLAARGDDAIVLDASVIEPEPRRWVSGLDHFLLAGHIPGAAFADVLEEFSAADSPFRFTRPSIERLATALHEVGVDGSRPVVVYDGALGQFAARLWWLLRSAGLDDVAILDGGFTKWRAEQRPVETGYRAPHPVNPPRDLQYDPAWWIDTPGVQRIVAGDRRGTLVCAVRPSAFRGETGPGHIPGSANIPLPAFVDYRGDHALRPDSHLREVFAQVPDGPVVVYCGSAVLGAAAGFALRLLGRTEVALYDGSLDEWTATPGTPIAL